MLFKPRHQRERDFGKHFKSCFNFGLIPQNGSQNEDEGNL
jgi:hypothetical protein